MGAFDDLVPKKQQQVNAFADLVPKKRELSDVPLEALKNAPASAGRFVEGIYQAVRHPVDTGMALWDTAAGALRNALPESVQQLDASPAAQRASQAASAAGQFFKDRYGSGQAVIDTLATDPVGAAADVSTVLTGGAALAARSPQVAGALSKAAQLTNPLSVVAPTLRAVGKVGKPLLGLTTGVGAENVATAAKSGYAGKPEFMANLSGKADMTDVLETARANVQAMGRAKSAEYRSGMAQVSADKSVLSFGGIDKAVIDAGNMASFKGQVKNARAAKAVEEIAEEVKNWKGLDPAEYHTPEGLDALKQRIGGILESIPYEEKTARTAAKGVYRAVKDEISKQAPTYSKTMKEYSEATELITEIERALSLRETAAADTAMRKLQSLARNNVQTNYGNRLSLAQQLEAQGGQEILPAIAGQAMNSWTARSLVGQGGNLATLGAALSNPGFLAALPLQSPRVVGATLYGGGRLAGLSGNALSRVGVTPQRARTAGLFAGQLGRNALLTK